MAYPPVKVARSSAKSAPASAVVVLLPLVPVMATTGTSPRKRQASSTSPQTGTPVRRAAWIGAMESGTPGETTTRSAPEKSPSSWPPSTLRIGSPASAASGSASSASGLRSVTVTFAPSRAQSFAAATPLFASPMTVTFLLRRTGASATGLPQLERQEGDERQHDRDDPEAHDDLGLRPALQLVVVVDGGHAEDPSAGPLEPGHLDHHADDLDEEDAVQDAAGELVLGEDGEGPEAAAQPERP